MFDSTVNYQFLRFNLTFLMENVRLESRGLFHNICNYLLLMRASQKCYNEIFKSNGIVAGEIITKNCGVIIFVTKTRFLY